MNVIQHEKEYDTCFAECFEATDLGAPFKVILHNSVKVKLGNTDEILSYTIPDLDGLIRAVVITRILHPRKLLGADLKFIRKAVSLKQKDAASKIEMSPEHLSRCEASGPNGLVMSPSGDKLFRILTLKTALKLHRIKACDKKTKLEDALDRLFDGIKPVSVFNIDDDLEFHFHRSRPSNSLGDCNEDEGQWDDALDAA